LAHLVSQGKTKIMPSSDKGETSWLLVVIGPYGGESRKTHSANGETAQHYLVVFMVIMTL
jgi:hypothetical protein